MTDIAIRMRDMARDLLGPYMDIALEGADEIVRLRAANAGLADSLDTVIHGIERLRIEREELLGLIDMLGKRALDIERLRAALSKYADPNYNGYNGGPEHARAALEDEP